MKPRLQREDQLYASCYCEENVYLCLRSQSLIDPTSVDEFTVVFLSNPAGCIPLFAQRAAKQPGIPVFWDYHVILVHKPSSSITTTAAAAVEDNAAGGIIPVNTGDEITNDKQQEDGDDKQEKEGDTGAAAAVVYDLDTTLPDFPVSFAEYFYATFYPPKYTNNNNNNNSSTNAVNIDEWLLYRLSDPAYTRYMRLVPGGLFLKKFASSRVHMRRRRRQPPPPPPPPITSSDANKNDNNDNGGEGDNEDNGEVEWLAEPPVWECLRGEEAESEHTLPKFLDFSRAGGIVRVLEKEEEEEESQVGKEKEQKEEDRDGDDDGYGRIVDEEKFWLEFMGDDDVSKKLRTLSVGGEPEAVL